MKGTVESQPQQINTGLSATSRGRREAHAQRHKGDNGGDARLPYGGHLLNVEDDSKHDPTSMIGSISGTHAQDAARGHTQRLTTPRGVARDSRGA